MKIQELSNWVERNGLILLIALIFVTPLIFFSIWVSNKRQNALEQLHSVEQRYARMLGVASKKGEISELLKNTVAIRSDYAYPESVDSNQAAAETQQELRRIMGGAGIQVQSMQVHVNNEDTNGYEKISVILNASGQWEQIQNSLSSLKSVRPYILIDALKMNLRGDLQASIVYSPIINMQLNLSFYRRKPL